MREPNYKYRRCTHGNAGPNWRDGDIVRIEETSNDGHDSEIVDESPK